MTGEGAYRDGAPIAFVETPPEIADLAAWLIEYAGEGAFLDTGCGRGAFLAALLRRGYKRLEAVEISPSLKEECLAAHPSVRVHGADFLSWDPGRRYAAIVGNPPYMHCSQLPPPQRRRVKEIAGTLEANIYYAFILKAVDLLEQGGQLVYLVPYDFFYNTHASVVRQKLSREGYLHTVVDLDEASLFDGASPETVLFKFVKSRLARETRVLRLRDRRAKAGEILEAGIEALEKEVGNILFTFHRSSTFTAARGQWSTYPRVPIPHGRALGQVAEVCVGMLAGHSEAFSLSEEEYALIPEGERAIVLPFVKARHCRGFWAEGKEWKVVVGDAASTEDELRSRYPTIYEHLRRRKRGLEDRYLQGRSWFNWMALRNRGIFDSGDPKIFTPALDRSEASRFSLVRGRVYAEGDVTAVVPRSVDPSICSAT
jgi:adenine-specific DNA-methyltransferase